MYTACIELVHSWQRLHGDWAVTAETQMTRRRILLFTFSHLSVVFYITIAKSENLINIPINITENNVDWNSYRAKWHPRPTSSPGVPLVMRWKYRDPWPGPTTFRGRFPFDLKFRTFSGISFRNFRCTSRACPNIPENRNNRKILFHSTIPSRPSFSEA